MIESHFLITNGVFVRDFSWNKGQINALLGAAIFIATAGGKYEFSEIEQQSLEILAFFLLSNEVNVEDVQTASPIELAATFHDNEQKKRALEFLVLVIYSTNDYLDEKKQLLDDYLRSLKLSDLLLKQLSQVHFQYYQLIKYNEFRKQLDLSKKELMKTDFASPFLLSNSNLLVIEEQYKKMTLLARNSLGYNLYKSYRKNKLPLPGEYSVANEKLIVIYDIVKLITGYKYDVRGDLNTLAYIAGNQTVGSFIISGIAILEYYCHNPDSIKRVNKLERKKFWNIAKSGMNCQLDLSNSWDYESNYRKSLTELRKEFNLK